jgi:hypothetical protein
MFPIKIMFKTVQEIWKILLNSVIVYDYNQNMSA